jgi:hypothetical protein
MVDMMMDRDVQGLGPSQGDEILASNGRIVLLYDGCVVGETSKGRGKQYALYAISGDTIQRRRACKPAEVTEITSGLESKDYDRCRTKHVCQGSVVMFITR